MRLAGAVILILAVAQTALAVPDLVPLEGRLRSERPLEAQGDLSVLGDAGLVLTVEPADASGAVMAEAPRAVFRVLEEREGVPAPAPPGAPVALTPATQEPGWTEIEHAELDAPKIGLVQGGMAPAWQLRALSNVRIPTSTGVACGLAAHPRPAPAFHSWNGTGPVVPLDRDVWVRVDCPVPALEVQGHFLAVFDDVGVHVRYRDGSATAERTFEARRGTTVDVVLQHDIPVVRRRLVTVEGLDGAHVSPTPAPSVTVLAPAVVAQGRLTIPPSLGVLRWGDEERRDPTEAVNATGAFTLRGESPSDIVLQGYANRPSTAVPARGASLPIAAVVASGAGLLLLAWLLRIAGGVLFTRVAQSHALDQAHRRMLYELIQQRPTLTVQDLVAAAGLNRGTVRHHLRILAQQGLVQGQRIGARTVFAPAGRTLPPQEVRLRRRLEEPHVRSLLEAVRRQPGATHRELAAAADLSRASVTRIVRELTDVGLLRAEPDRDGRRTLAVVDPPTPRPAY